MRGYFVKYTFKTEKPHSSYEYQRFFRAIFGYTQVVVKKNGRRYVYMREGVLTRYPYIRRGRSTVVIPEEALGPLLTFFKTGKNPAHAFTYLGDWKVTYFMQEVDVKPDEAASAILSALERIIVAGVPLYTVLQHVDTQRNDVLASAYAAGGELFRTRWFQEVLSLGLLPEEIAHGYKTLERLFG